MRSRLGRRRLDPLAVLGAIIVALLFASTATALARLSDGADATSDDTGSEATASDAAMDEPGGLATASALPAATTPAPPTQPAVDQPSVSGTVEDPVSGAPPAAAPDPSEAAPATPAVAGPTAPPATPSVGPGTCFNGRATTVSAIEPVNCGESHGSELYAVLVDESPPDASYPGEETLLDRTAEICRGEAFDSYVGVAWGDSAWWTGPMVPSEQTWAEGDRAVACFLYDLRGATTGSARGSAR